MGEGLGGQQAAARGALQEALLDQVGLDDVFQRVARLGQGGGAGLDADRTALEIAGDDPEIAAVHGSQPAGIDLEPLAPRNAAGGADRLYSRAGGEVDATDTHPTEDP